MPVAPATRVQQPRMSPHPAKRLLVNKTTPGENRWPRDTRLRQSKGSTGHEVTQDVRAKQRRVLGPPSFRGWGTRKGQWGGWGPGHYVALEAKYRKRSRRGKQSNAVIPSSIVRAENWLLELFLSFLFFFFVSPCVNCSQESSVVTVWDKFGQEANLSIPVFFSFKILFIYF